MYVPRGWWHMVVNIAPITIAVSHHFLSPSGLYNTLRVLRETPYEVSGIDRGLAPRTSTGIASPDEAAEDHKRRTAAGTAMHDKLVAALQKHRPEVLAQAEQDLKKEELRKRERKRGPLLAATVAAGDGKTTNTTEVKAFSFNFAP